MSQMADTKQQISDLIKKINDKNPYYLIIAVLFVVLIADYLLIMQFQLKALQSLSPKNATLKEEYISTTNNIKRMPQYRRDSQKIGEEIASFHKRIRSKEEIPLLMENISRIAEHDGVHIQQISPGNTPDKPLLKTAKGSYFAVPILLEARGGYHQFATFMNKMESQEMLMTVPSFTIADAGSDPSMHEIRLTINAIVFEKH